MSASNSDTHPPESFEAFLATSRAGYIYTSPDGRITYANTRIVDWLLLPRDALIGTRLTDHFPIARKVYYETHLAPLLRMQGHFDEVALELARADGTHIPVLVNGVEHNDASGATTFVRFAFFPAIQRRSYERNLVSAKAATVTDNTRLREQVAADARERMKVEADLSNAQQAAALREQFIAVLGHDLRNPLAAIEGAMRLLAKTPLNDRATSIVTMVHQSVGRMANIIDNVMDFARGRLGGGFIISPRNTDIEPTLEHVVHELQIAWPDRAIASEFNIGESVYCDAHRIGQLLSNLLANALSHGAADGVVRVTAKLKSGLFELAVTNNGSPIPDEALGRLFEPFTREDVRSSQQGLGLGLYIVSEIAHAHGGTVSAKSSAQETSFTLKMPAAKASQ